MQVWLSSHLLQEGERQSIVVGADRDGAKTVVQITESMVGPIAATKAATQVLQQAAAAGGTRIELKSLKTQVLELWSSAPANSDPLVVFRDLLPAPSQIVFAAFRETITSIYSIWLEHDMMKLGNRMT